MSRGAPKAPITYAGEYDATRTYLPLQIATFDGGVYLSVATSTGADPDPAAVTPWLPMGAPAGAVVIPVLHGDPATLVEGLIWYDLDATCS